MSDSPRLPDSTTRQRVLVLTGASRGIGHATARVFSAVGWRVITVSRQAFSPLCPWAGGPQDHLQLDLGNIDALPAGLEEMRARLPDGRLDALVNNAAISPKGPGGSRLGLLDTDPAT
jgi:NAD(P)-dependent dehydrogenase (short-subunit alcohol dehydrogenase family)